MPLTRQQKEESVKQVQEGVSAATSVVFVSYNGLTVEEVSELRANLHSEPDRERQKAAIKEERLRELVAQARDTGDFSNVPAPTFTDQPWSDWSIPITQDYLRDACLALAEKGPEKLLKSFHDLNFTLAKHLFQLTSLADIVSTAQLNLIQCMGDDEFVRLFSSKVGRSRLTSLRCSVGNRTKTTTCKELQRVLKHRHKKLLRR